MFGKTSYKEAPTAYVTETGQGYEAAPPQIPTYKKPPNKNTRAWKDIIVGCFIISIPLSLLSVALLAVIFANKVKVRSPIPALQNPNTTTAHDGAYLVDFSATRLLTIASLTSSVAPFLPGFVMTLLSFPAARRVIQASKRGSSQKKMTPYQLGLYLQLMTASLGSLYQWVKYKGWAKKEKKPPVLRMMVGGLLLSCLLGYAILACDTWLHITTSTVLFESLTAVKSDDYYNYGRGFFSDKCKTQTDLNLPCSVESNGIHEFLIEQPESLATLNSVSDINYVDSIYHEGINYAMLLPMHASTYVDYRANTIALATQCRPVSKECNMQATLNPTPFRCNNQFYRDVDNTTNFEVFLFESEKYDSAVDVEQKNTYFGKNPFQLATWAVMDSQGKPGKVYPADSKMAQLLKDKDIIQPKEGGMAYVVECTATVYEAEYSVINNTIMYPKFTKASDGYAAAVAAPVTQGFANAAVEQAHRAASVVSGTAQELASGWGDQYSQISLSLVAGAMTPRKNLDEQFRLQALVAKVPKAPLFALVLLNIMYVGLGVVLTLYAILFTRVGSGTGAARQRLTVQGLVAATFEPTERAVLGGNKVEDMFVERDNQQTSLRVGVDDIGDGGWRFTTV